MLASTEKAGFVALPEVVPRTVRVYTQVPFAGISPFVIDTSEAENDAATQLDEDVTLIMLTLDGKVSEKFTF